MNVRYNDNERSCKSGIVHRIMYITLSQAQEAVVGLNLSGLECSHKPISPKIGL